MTYQQRRSVTAITGVLCGAGLMVLLMIPVAASSHSTDDGLQAKVEHVAPWINDDGTVNEKAAPDIVPVYGPDGKVVVRDGVEMGVRLSDLAAFDTASGDSARSPVDASGLSKSDALPAADLLSEHLVPLP